MFKYTPPWQVLCHSLEQNSKSHTSFASGNPQDAHKREGQTMNRSCQPTENQLSPKNIMGSTPKRWVIKPLTPRLDKSDLRAMLSPTEPCSPDNTWNYSQDGGSPTFKFDNVSVTRVQSSVTVSAPNGETARDTVVHARQVVVFDEDSTTDEWQPSDPSSPSTPSSTDSHMGFYSFVEDPTSPEAEKNEAYMVSPERQAKLSTLTEKNCFKLQTYVEDRRPEKLFEESNGDSCYLAENVSAEDSDEEKPDRMEIIRDQAPKKNPVFKEQWSALENLDLRDSPKRLVEGFSLCYSPVSTKSLQAEIEPGAIDSQQIDFNAARKQFQMMERSKQNPFCYSPQQLPSFSKLRARSLSADADIFTKEVSNHMDEPSQNEMKSLKLRVTLHEDPEERFPYNLIDDLDSGVERSVDCISDGSSSSEPSKPEMRFSYMSETPIEKEIRIASEREEDLRRSRGIFHTDTSEMVEIKTKPILSQPLPPQLKPIKAKETNRVSFLIQQEMDRVNRNQKLYDKGTSVDLGETKRILESQSDQVPLRSVTVEDNWIADHPILEEQRDVPDSLETLSPCCPHRHQDEAIIQKDPVIRTTFYTREGATWAQDNGAKVPNQPTWIADYKFQESGRTVSSTERPSSPSEAVRRSKSTVTRRLLWESSNEWPRMLSASDMIRKEIEEDLRREQELQVLRETSNLSLTKDKGNSEPTSEPVSGQVSKDQASLKSSQENLVEVDDVLPEKSTQMTNYSLSYSLSDSTPTRMSLAGSRLPSVSIMTAQPWSSPKPASLSSVPRAIPALLTTPRPEASSTPSQKGLTETLLEDFEERRVRLKLEESSYAGIQPVDAINNEVVEATRVTRHKSPKALRWEAGVYANEENN